MFVDKLDSNEVFLSANAGSAPHQQFLLALALTKMSYLHKGKCCILHTTCKINMK